MSASEVIDFFAPHPSTSAAVTSWLESSGIPASRISLSTNKQWLQFDATAAEVEELLYADFYLWEHGDSGVKDIATEEYHLPGHIQEHVDYITPGSRLRQRSMKRMDHEKLKKRVVAQPQITQLPGFPNPNASVCDIYVTAECTRGMSLVSFPLCNFYICFETNDLCLLCSPI